MPLLYELKKEVSKVLEQEVTYRDNYSGYVVSRFEKYLEHLASVRGHQIGFFSDVTKGGVKAITLDVAKAYALKAAKLINHEGQLFDDWKQNARPIPESERFTVADKDRPHFRFYVLEAKLPDLAKEACETSSTPTFNFKL